MKPCDQNIKLTIQLTQEMIRLADQGDADREDTGCGVLYGVLRDAAFKIRQLAEQEKGKHQAKGWWQEECSPSGRMKSAGPLDEINNRLIQEDIMTVRLEVYRCEVCGNIVEVMNAGPGELVCCGQAMTCLKENTVDAALEKHVPVIEKIEGGVKVKVGSVAHPMEEKHFIQWIELIADGNTYRQFLNPGDAPEAVFMVSGASITAREYCNLHGHWKSA